MAITGSYAIAAIAGTSTGIFLALILITTCTIFVRCRMHRKLVQFLMSCWPISTRFKELDEIAGETTVNIIEKCSSSESYQCGNNSPIFNPRASGEIESGINFTRKPCVIQFSLFYNFHDSRLFVHIICALNVPLRWYGRSPDTQVRLQLLPDIDHAYHTEIRINETQPIFNETFEFVGYSARELLELTLRIGFYAFDKFSRGKLLGYTTVPFEHIEWYPSQAKILWRTLVPPVRCNSSSSICREIKFFSEFVTERFHEG
ncbi:synaptotagmin-3-like [Actinia tenebrosa]|uniref:Synaptotagmin-3-like n=1 Tax=Actinia tenebrosa TaxID=6105 RepID=A0A6P8H8D1_ACTTE|nr:synaptotagmin-3-like [Actinia tenebrosa]